MAEIRRKKYKRKDKKGEKYTGSAIYKATVHNYEYRDTSHLDKKLILPANTVTKEELEEFRQYSDPDFEMDDRFNYVKHRPDDRSYHRKHGWTNRKWRTRYEVDEESEDTTLQERIRQISYSNDILDKLEIQITKTILEQKSNNIPKYRMRILFADNSIEVMLGLPPYQELWSEEDLVNECLNIVEFSIHENYRELTINIDGDKIMTGIGTTEALRFMLNRYYDGE